MNAITPLKAQLLIGGLILINLHAGKLQTCMLLVQASVTIMLNILSNF